MTKSKMRPDAMKMDAKVNEETAEVKEVRVVFMEGKDEFSVKMDLNLLAAFRDAADAVLSTKGTIKMPQEKIPGYA